MPTFTKSDIEHGQTYYSPEFAGDEGNYTWSASVSVTAPGYVRIQQTDEDGKVKDVVLLTPEQWQAISSFVSRPKAGR